MHVLIEFHVERPSGHYTKKRQLLKNTAPDHPAVKPDIDKLVRCTLDALSGVAFDDDARIVSLTAHKRYRKRGTEAGADITIQEAV